MVEFKFFFESFDTVQDFLSNPVHNDKDRWEWMKDFESSGGQFLGQGSYGSVYSHPKWPYVVKTFTQDEPYVKFLRWSMKNPNKSFPKMYGKPTQVIPPYKRQTDKADKFYAVRLEKLNPINDSDWQLFDKYKTQVARHFYYKDNQDEFNRFYEAPTREDYNERAADVINMLPNNVLEAIYGYYLMSRANYHNEWGAEDLHQRNVMQRDNGDIVLADPVWYGYNPYEAARENEKMEYDYYGGGSYDTPEPKHVRGGKLPKRAREKKPKPSVPAAPTYSDHEDDDIPF